MNTNTNIYKITTDTTKEELEAMIASVPIIQTNIDFAFADSYTTTNGYSVAAGRNKTPVNVSVESWADFIAFLIQDSNKVFHKKEDIMGIFGCQFAPGATEKTLENIVLKSPLLPLDLEGDGLDVDMITPLLDQLDCAYVIYTTHSSNAPGKGNRLRVWMPLSRSYTPEEWGSASLHQDGTIWKDLKHFLYNKWGFVPDTPTVNDGSSAGIGHYQAAPAINPAVGYVNIWISNNTKLFDLDYHLNAIPLSDRYSPKVKLQKIVQTTTKEVDEEFIESQSDNKFEEQVIAVMEDDDRFNQLLAIIKSKGIKAKYNDSNIGTGGSRTALAMAIQKLFGKTSTAKRRFFDPIFEIISTDKSIQESNKVWANVEKDSFGYIGFFYSVLTKADKEKLGFISNTPSDQYRKDLIADNNKWEFFSNKGNYVSQLEYQYSGVINSPFGTGKTTTVKSIAKALMGVPTKAIREQARNSKVDTWDSLNKRFTQEMQDEIDEWTIVFDEMHGIPLAYYRPKAMTAVYHAIDRASYNNKVAFQSGTLDYAEAEALSKSLRIRNFKLKKNSYNPMSKVTYIPVTYEDKVKKNDTLYTLIADIIKKTPDELVYVVRDNKEDNNEIAAELIKKGIYAIAINADKVSTIEKIIEDRKDPAKPKVELTTEQSVIYKFMNDGDFEMGKYTYPRTAPAPNPVAPLDYDPAYFDISDVVKPKPVEGKKLQVILITRMGCEGVNVQDKVDHASVIVVGDIEHVFLKQSSGRFRAAGAVDLYHVVGHTKKRGCDIDTVCNEWDTNEYWIKMKIDQFNSRPENKREPHHLNTYTDEPSLDAKSLVYGYVYDEIRKQIVKAQWYPLCRMMHISNHKFYQSWNNQITNMEVFGCTISPTMLKIGTELEISDQTIESIELLEEERIRKVNIQITQAFTKATESIGEDYLGTTPLYNVWAYISNIDFNKANEIREAMDASGINDVSESFIPVITQYFTNQIDGEQMKTIIATKNQKYTQDKLAEWKGKIITNEDMMAIAQGLLDSHIELRIRDGMTRTEAIETMSRFSDLWKDKIDKAGKVKFKQVKSFLATYCGFIFEDRYSKIKDEEGNRISVRTVIVKGDKVDKPKGSDEGPQAAPALVV